jgi:hypothetical protein
VPCREQQFHPLMAEHGLVRVTEESRRTLATRRAGAIAARRGDSVAP